MSYLDTVDAVPPAERWRLVRRLMAEQPHPFFAEVRERRPVMVLPELTLAFRYADCALILRRHDDFGVDLYAPKQGAYFMAQDDTADHWRDKSIMRSILDFEQIPQIRAFVTRTTAELLKAGSGRIDLPAAITRAVPVAVVREFFGFAAADPAELTECSYWSQQDAFHNQPFDESSEAELIVAEREKGSVRLAQLIGAIIKDKAAALRSGGGAAAAGDDPITRLLRLSFSGGLKLPLEKVGLNAGGLLVGAVETTSHAVNNVIAELFDRPETLAGARAAARDGDPEEIDGYALEALRLRPAFPWFFRTARRDSELAGGTPFATVVPKGTTVLAMTHSAMSDRASFPEPERFDPARSQADNFTFGQGIHECLGRAVAKPMVGEIVRQILLLPGLRPDGAVVMRRGVPESLAIRWEA